LAIGQKSLSKDLSIDIFLSNCKKFQM